MLFLYVVSCLELPLTCRSVMCEMSELATFSQAYLEWSMRCVFSNGKRRRELRVVLRWSVADVSLRPASIAVARKGR